MRRSRAETFGSDFGDGAHTRKFLRRHDEKKLMIRFRKKDEFLGAMRDASAREW